ncbi:iron ABC transporter permease [Brochothrix thermosphacta]|uniref:FecCD family ABC transporter permease n=1 Tax=Brochothrix thermosphacta TaxID=2756 RepID=UPI0027135103|nr:iron ABC transporter permease [Brochothrix thermosphacta]MDO7863888.1 iron ABC transporter permease [Brochothrix thermosphacta]
MKIHQRFNRQIVPFVPLITVLIVVFIWSLNTGKMSVSPFDLLAVFTGQGTPQQNLIVFDFRMPKIVLSVFVGAGMGIAGCIMQSLLKNDMASPGTLGISSGSGLFMILFLFTGLMRDTPAMLPIVAFVGGVVAAGLIFLLASKRKQELSPTRLILTGVALGTGYDAVTLFLSLRMDTQQHEFVQRWLAGSLWGADWLHLSILIPVVLFLAGGVYFHAPKLNIIHLGNETALGLGVPLKLAFIGFSLAAILLSSASVAIGGNFFFVGMISPHIAKKLVGVDHKRSLPASALVGSIMILLADTLIRSSALDVTIPAGLLITIVSTPYFIYLMAKSR